jgi:hypothetical protein
VEAGGSGWKTVLIGKYALAIELADSRTERSYYKTDAAHHKLMLFSNGEASSYTYQQTGSNELMLSARGKHSVKLRKIADRKFPLLERGFHWINEYPLNR